MMKKMIVAGTLALTVAGAGLALAQQAPKPDAPRLQRSPEDRAAFTDARIAALKAGLQLTAEQEKNWPAVETAIRDLAKQRAERMTARMKELSERRAARRNTQPGERAQRPDAIARLRSGADVMTTRGAALKKLADAAEPLYKSLDEGQKRRFAMLLRMGGQAGAGPRHGRWRRGGGPR